MSTDADDDPDLLPCSRHPGQLTALACVDCEQPICVDCAVQGAVGMKCPSCARTSRAERGVIPTRRLTRGLLAAAVTAIVFGALLELVRVPFLGIILAWLAGTAAGEAARRGSGGFRDPLLARGAAVLAAVGMLAPLVILMLGTGLASPPRIAWAIVFALAAAYGAWNRSS